MGLLSVAASVYGLMCQKAFSTSVAVYVYTIPIHPPWPLCPLAIVHVTHDDHTRDHTMEG